MEYLGVSYEARHLPKLDPQFIHFGAWMEAYQKGAQQPLAIAVERDQAIFLCTIRRSTARRRWRMRTTAMWSGL